MRWCLVGLLVLVGCGPVPEYVRGPGIPTTTFVQVQIDPLKDETAKRVIVTKPESLRFFQRVCNDNAWQKNDDDRPLVPHYRLTMTAKDGTTSTYFLGSFSDPPLPPCFHFCSGYWLTAAKRDGGGPRGDSYRALATSGDLLHLMELFAR